MTQASRRVTFSELGLPTNVEDKDLQVFLTYFINFLRDLQDDASRAYARVITTAPTLETLVDGEMVVFSDTLYVRNGTTLYKQQMTAV